METAYQVTCTYEDSSKLHGLMTGRVKVELLMTHQDWNRFATRMCAHFKATERVIQSVCATCKSPVCTCA